jgi:hypothetical protein
MVRLDRDWHVVALVGRGTIVSMLTALALLCVSPPADAAHRPLERGRTRAPFGHHYRPACGSAKRGRMQCFAEVVAASSTTAAPAVVNAAPVGYGPADLQSAYGLSSASATRGGTQTVAVIDAYDDPSAESDLSAYRGQYGLPPCTTANGCFRKVNQNGGSNYPSPSPAGDDWALETSLDLDMVSAICPNCHILLVEANDDGGSPSNLAIAANEAAALGGTQVSNSYGTLGEFSGETSLDRYYHHPGIAVIASTGDQGYEDCNYDCSGVQYPAASQYVIAAGGTTLNRDSSARGWSESAWSGAGSGCSLVEPKPFWQHDSNCTMRMLADTSADADPNTGAAVYSTSDGYGWITVGGTSEAAPITAGVDALIGPAAASPQYPYANAVDYFDVVTGSNGSCSDYQCNAGPGYDGPTGIGTPNGAALFSTSSCSAGPSVSQQPTNQTVTAPAAASFSAAATNPSGCSTLTVQWQVSTNGGSTWTNDATDAGNKTTKLTIDPTSVSLSGHKYRAVFSNQHGSTNSSTATLTVRAHR